MPQILDSSRSSDEGLTSRFPFARSRRNHSVIKARYLLKSVRGHKYIMIGLIFNGINASLSSPKLKEKKRSARKMS